MKPWVVREPRLHRGKACRRLRITPRSQTSWMRCRTSSRASRSDAGGIQTVGSRSPRQQPAVIVANTVAAQLFDELSEGRAILSGRRSETIARCPQERRSTSRVLPHYPPRGRYSDALESSSSSTEPGQLQSLPFRDCPAAGTWNGAFASDHAAIRDSSCATSRARQARSRFSCPAARYDARPMMPSYAGNESRGGVRPWQAGPIRVRRPSFRGRRDRASIRRHSDDLLVWRLFYGPNGGEVPA